jgi:hypothetical protein
VNGIVSNNFQFSSIEDIDICAKDEEIATQDLESRLAVKDSRVYSLPDHATVSDHKVALEMLKVRSFACYSAPESFSNHSGSLVL